MSETISKEQKIQTLASILRDQLSDIADLEMAMEVLFKGCAEVQSDNDGQIMVYTGHTYGCYTGEVTCMESKEYLNA